MADWNAAQYLKFQAERTQPAIDLANRVALENPADILDIGCGPGNSTRVLQRRFPRARILGIDSSPAMVEAAQAACPDLSFRLCDAGRELGRLGQKFDLVFSNACLQWVPDHAALLPSMMALLKENGVLAVQIPMNYEEPIHRIIGALAASARWKGKLQHPRVFYTLSQEQYFDLLAGLSREFTLWQTTYFHRMKSHADIIEWYRGTGLRPYLEALDGAGRMEFEREVYTEVSRAYPQQANGEIIFRFPRFFFTAVK